MEIVRLFSICLPSDYASQVNLSQRCYEVRSKNWNQSVGKRRSSRRAIAGTETEVFFNNQWEDLDYGGPPGLAARLKLGVTAWGGGSWSTTDTCEGSLQGSVVTMNLILLTLSFLLVNVQVYGHLYIEVQVRVQPAAIPIHI